MREKFREFYFDKDDEKIWEESVIVLDTNVLLNLYRYTKETSDQILGLLHKYSEQLWIPHQVALEYHYNRKSVIMEQNGSYKKVCSAFNAVPNKVKDMLNQNLSSYKKRHKEDVEEFIKVIKKVTEDQIKNLNENVVEYDLNKDDVIKTKITELYYNKVGEPFNEEQMKELEKDADKRLNMEIPPGYKDYNKKNGHKFYNGVIIQNKYGDLILWKQLLDFAVRNNTNIIFLTDEQKEDWWYDLKSKIIGPKVELLNEFTSLTNKEFHMFTSLGFVERHESYLNPDTVSEVREVSKDYQTVKKYEKKNRDELNGEYEKFPSRRLKIKHEYKTDSFKPDFLDSKTLMLFCSWFYENSSMFIKDNYKFTKFFEILEDEFDQRTANKIMKFLYSENLVKEDKERNVMVIKMDQLKTRVYMTIIDYTLLD
ncbi:PIN-like domain-containing protein [Bacillus altitudinis]|uniref:PIN-like domain-containing protein n=1 Tax=Bacillus altitudinis TaxID=293387 RepID=A0ABV1S568_BACAB